MEMRKDAWCLPEGQKMHELENIKLYGVRDTYLKFFIAPINTKAYGEKLAFAVYFQYESEKIRDNNLTKRLGNMPRFFIDSNVLVVDRELSLFERIKNDPSYLKYRFEILQEKIFQSVGNKTSKKSSENCDWFKDNRHLFSTRSSVMFHRETFPKWPIIKTETEIITETEVEIIETIISEPEVKADTKTALKNENRLVPDVSAIKKFIKTNRRHLKKVA
jgi:hypothetical protein